MKAPLKGYVLAGFFLLSIIVSAALVEYVGIMPVGFGMMAPAGAYVIGLTMVLRDLTQDQLGPKQTFIFMIAGTILSALISPAIALASALAFLVAQTLDMAVYTPIRARGKLIIAVLASNAVGIVADSFVFVTMVFGFAPEFILGQSWAKALSTIAAVVVLKAIYRHRTDKRPAYLVRRELQRASATA